MSTLTPSHLRKIHVLARERKIDNEELHAFVYSLTKKDSLKELSVAQAINVINNLSGKKYTPPGMMTDNQYKYMLGLTRDLGWLDDEGAVDESRINGFILSEAKMEKLEWVTSAAAGKIIEALKNMKKRMEAVS